MRSSLNDSTFWCDAEPSPTQKICVYPACSRVGDYRAPQSPQRLNQYYWFCLEHVRAYNAQWDFAKGMNAEQIEHLIRMDVGWQRETRPLGNWRTREQLLRAKAAAFQQGATVRPAPSPKVSPQVSDALAQLDLTLPMTDKELRTKYLVLVKRYHPDRNHGDHEADAKLKDINLAYAVLRDFIRQYIKAH